MVATTPVWRNVPELEWTSSGGVSADCAVGNGPRADAGADSASFFAQSPQLCDCFRRQWLPHVHSH